MSDITISLGTISADYSAVYSTSWATNWITSIYMPSEINACDICGEFSCMPVQVDAVCLCKVCFLDMFECFMNQKNITKDLISALKKDTNGNN